MRPTFQYAFAFEGFNRESVKEVLINQKLISPSTGLRLYAPISEYAKRYTELNKDYFRRWGIGFIIEKTKNVMGLHGLSNLSSWKIQDEYFVYDLPGNLTIDFGNSPDDTAIALAPTLSELKQLVYKDPKEDFPHWYWKGIACDWLYSPRTEDLIHTEPLIDTPNDDTPIIQRVVRAKTENEISEYLSPKAVKGKHFSLKNKVSYTEPQGSLF